MNILIIRHALAEDAETYTAKKGNDARRPLSDDGIAKMHRVAVGLHRLVDHIDIIGHSPFRRAVQTAQIVDKYYSKAHTLEVEELVPGSGAQMVANWLEFISRDATVALIGHEPDLSQLIGWLTVGEASSFVQLKRSGAALLSCEGKPSAGCAELLWMLTPKQLRKLAD